MDPLTAVGAVASVIQLAQTALSLSKTLYSLGAAVASASEDIQVLAQDLKTFSQSLTILSRLLEDSRSWYSDDIYLLTARIIKDCAELYVKIDKILVKLGSNGKSTWKLRVKFVYKEGQIKKLMKQLRDMKGTLATILMSLQVDLQLSLLNISSPSKIQRPPELPLQPETIETLREAQEAVKAADLLPKYSEKLGSQVNLQGFMETSSNAYPTRRTANETREIVRPSLQARTLGDIQSDAVTSSQAFDVNQSFVMLPSAAQMACTQTREQNVSPSPSRDVHVGMKSKSIKSSSSTESFKSAISMQQTDLDVARQVKAVRAVMHAFQTALQILDNLVERQMSIRKGEVYRAAKDLRNFLHGCSKDIDGTHIANFKGYGLVYIGEFDTKNSMKLQESSSIIMREIVMKLHEFSAEHEDLSKSGFDELHELAEKISCQILTLLNQLVPSQEETLGRQFYIEAPVKFDAAPMPSPETTPQIQDCKQKIGERVKMPVKCRSTPSDSEGGLKRFRYRMVQSSRPPKDAPELSLPFIGYTFKRFDNYSGKDAATLPLPISAPQTSTPPNVTAPNRDFTSGPDSNLDVLEEFDFDSFLHQDDDSVKFEVPTDDSGSTSTASRKPYTPVRRCNASFGFVKDGIENRNEDSFQACNACISHSARCDAARPICINCYVNRLECQYIGQAHAEKQDHLYAVEEELPIFINAKQFHRILKRRAARQALEEETSTRNTSDRFPERTTGNMATIPASQASYPPTTSTSASSAHTHGDGANPPQQILTIHTSSSLHDIPVDICAASRLPDEKRVRSAQASARFRARRKAKEKEMIEQGAKEREETEDHVEGRPENAIEPHRSVHDFPAKTFNKKYDPYTTLFLSASYDPPTPQKSSSRLDKPLPLSPSQETKLWWRSLAFTRLSNFAAFQIIHSEFSTELSIFFDFAIDDERLCTQVSSDIKRFEERNLRRESQDAGFNDILEMRMNILRIISTVDEQLGLQIAIFGWSCVCTVLHVYDHILGTNPADPALINTLTNIFTQLQEIVAIIARYAVMENLYHRSGSALSLKSEYRSSLLYLCSTILEYFSISLTLGRAIQDIDNTAEERQRMLQYINASTQLMLSIREKDQACQRFQVVVEAREENKTESEADIEDVSDDSWEEVRAPSSEDGLIDLDAALV